MCKKGKRGEKKNIRLHLVPTCCIYSFIHLCGTLWYRARPDGNISANIIYFLFSQLAETWQRLKHTAFWKRVNFSKVGRTRANTARREKQSSHKNRTSRPAREGGSEGGKREKKNQIALPRERDPEPCWRRRKRDLSDTAKQRRDTNEDGFGNLAAAPLKTECLPINFPPQIFNEMQIKHSANLINLGGWPAPADWNSGRAVVSLVVICSSTAPPWFIYLIGMNLKFFFSPSLPPAWTFPPLKGM